MRRSKRIASRAMHRSLTRASCLEGPHRGSGQRDGDRSTDAHRLAGPSEPRLIHDTAPSENPIDARWRTFWPLPRTTAYCFSWRCAVRRGLGATACLYKPLYRAGPKPAAPGPIATREPASGTWVLPARPGRTHPRRQPAAGRRGRRVEPPSGAGAALPRSLVHLGSAQGAVKQRHQRGSSLRASLCQRANQRIRPGVRRDVDRRARRRRRKVPPVRLYGTRRRTPT